MLSLLDCVGLYGCQSIELCIVSGRAGWQAQWIRRLREAWEGLSDDGQREGEMGADFGRKVEKKKKWLILSFVSLSCKVVAIESNLGLGGNIPHIRHSSSLVV